jgi:hypothetical protein
MTGCPAKSGAIGQAPLVALAAALLLAVGGCAATIPAQVTTFHELAASDSLAGRRFAFVPTAEQRGSLEYASYADRVRSALLRHSLVEAPSGSPTDFAVGLRYSTVPAVAAAWRDGHGSVGVGVSGGGFSFGGLGVGVGVGIPIGGGRAATTYRHEFAVEIDRTAPAARVFEGRAIAESDSSSIATVVPALVAALFESFPGPSGATRNVEVPLEPPGDR